MNRLALALEWLIYPLLAVLLLGPALYLLPATADPTRLASEVLAVTAAWGVVLAIVLSSALRGLPLFSTSQGSWAMRLLGAFAVWLLAGAVIGYNPAVSIGHAFTFLSFVLMGVSLVAWTERDGRRRGHVFAALAGVIVLQGMLAISQLLHFPWPALAEAVKAPWAQGALEAIAAPAKIGVAIGSFGNPNYLAEFMALTLPATFAWVAGRRGWPRLALALGLSFGLIALVATGSRAALLGMLLGVPVAALATWGFAAFDPRPWWRQPKSRMALVAGALVFVALTGVAGGRLASKLSHIGQPDAAIEARLINWGVGVELWKENPIMGSGVGTYKLRNVEKMMATHPDGAPKPAWAQRFVQMHNEPLQLLVETGLIGLLLVLGAFGFWFREVRRNAALDERLKFGVFAGVSALLIAGLFGFPLHIAWTAIALTLLLAIGLAGDAGETEPLPANWRPLYAFAAVGLCLTVAFQGLSKLVWPLQTAIQYEQIADALREADDRDGAEVVYGLAAANQRFKGQTIGSQVQMMFASKKYAEIVALLDASSKEGLDYGTDYYKARALFRLGRLDEAKVLFEKVAKFCKKDSTPGRGSIRFLKQIEAAEKNPAKLPKPEPAKVGAGR
jgi:O-antigen ligase